MAKIKISNILSGIKKIHKFGLYIPVTNVLLVYGSRFLPHRLLHIISNHRNRLIEDKIIGITGDCEVEANHPSGGGRIWVLWLQGEDNMPSIPRMCLNSIRKNSNGHEVVLLTLENLNQYIELPERIMRLFNQGKITAAHFSDIVRVALWATHGGFWIDSTMYLTEPIPNELFERDIFSMKSVATGFYVSECRWAGFCFYMNRRSVLPHMLYDMLFKYWAKETWLIDYFMLDYLIDIAVKKSDMVKSEIDDIPYNNPRLHDLCPLLCEKYDDSKFKDLTENTSFFKLSWKQYTQSELNAVPDNFYNKLMRLATCRDE